MSEYKSKLTQALIKIQNTPHLKLDVEEEKQTMNSMLFSLTTNDYVKIRNFDKDNQ